MSVLSRSLSSLHCRTFIGDQRACILNREADRPPGSAVVFRPPAVCYSLWRYHRESQGNASPYDPTFHMKNRLRLSSLVAVVAVAEDVAAVVAVHRLRVPDSVAPSPAVATILLFLISPALESDALHLILHVGLNILTDFGLISVWQPQPPW